MAIIFYFYLLLMYAQSPPDSTHSLRGSDVVFLCQTITTSLIQQSPWLLSYYKSETRTPKTLNNSLSCNQQVAVDVALRVREESHVQMYSEHINSTVLYCIVLSVLFIAQYVLCVASVVLNLCCSLNLFGESPALVSPYVWPSSHVYIVPILNL